MSSLVNAWKGLGLLACVGTFPLLVTAQDRFELKGGEFSILGALRGDQVFPELALSPAGGYLVWQDNATDGDGSGISARRINASLSGSFGGFRVNEDGAGEQTLPDVALLSNGAAVFVWQSAIKASTKVFARFVSPGGTFSTGDIAVSDFAGDQLTARVIPLADGNVLVVWSSIGQESLPDGRPAAGALQGIFARKFSPTGEKLSAEIQVNSNTSLNQRSPVAATLPNGNVAIIWISEFYRGVQFNFDVSGRNETGAGLDQYDVMVAGQLLDVNGTRIGGELRLSSAPTVCANPAITATKDGFTLAWSGRPNHPITEPDRNDGWDIYTRLFKQDGTAAKPEFRVNTFTYGDQFRPRLSFQDGINLILWTSMKQDGSWEGVVARLVWRTGDFLSREFRMNTTTAGKQIYPTVAADGAHTFLAVWSSYVGGGTSFDLLAQRYGSIEEQTLAAPAAPYVSALSQTRLSVTWPELAGYPGVRYQVYVDENSEPVTVENNSAIIVSLLPDTSHTVRLAYLLQDGRRSPLSAAASGKTWAEDTNFDGLPDDWQTRFWTADSSKWPNAGLDSDGDGASNLQELLAGTNPTDAASVLLVRISATIQGATLEWNTESGCIYQVQLQGAEGSWVSLGAQRFAAGKSDTIPVDSGGSVALYRVIRVR